MDTIENYFPTQYSDPTRIDVGTQWKMPNGQYWNTVTEVDVANRVIYYTSEDDSETIKQIPASENTRIIVKISNRAVTNLNKELLGDQQSWPRERVVSKG